MYVHIYHIAYLMVLGLGVPSTANHSKILLHHFSHKLREGGGKLPSNLLLGLGGVTEEKVNLGGTEVLGIDSNQDPVLVVGVNTNFIDGSGLALPLDGGTNNGKGALDELTNGVGLSGCQDVIIGLILLEHAPHTLDVIAGVAPITLGINVSKVEVLVDSLVDAGDGGGNLTGDEGAATAGTLMVEENGVGKVHAVGLTVIDKDPEGILLGNGVGRTGVEGSGLGLRDLLHLAVKLGGGGLVELDLLFHTTSADGIEHTKDSNTIGIGGILGHIEGNLDVRHGAEVVDLGRRTLAMMEIRLVASQRSP